jgi:hypothetical protein
MEGQPCSHEITHSLTQEVGRNWLKLNMGWDGSSLVYANERVVIIIIIIIITCLCAHISFIIPALIVNVFLLIWGPCRNSEPLSLTTVSLPAVCAETAGV